MKVGEIELGAKIIPLITQARSLVSTSHTRPPSLDLCTIEESQAVTMTLNEAPVISALLYEITTSTEISGTSHSAVFQA